MPRARGGCNRRSRKRETAATCPRTNDSALLRTAACNNSHEPQCVVNRLRASVCVTCVRRHHRDTTSFNNLCHCVRWTIPDCWSARRASDMAARRILVSGVAKRGTNRSLAPHAHATCTRRTRHCLVRWWASAISGPSTRRRDITWAWYVQCAWLGAQRACGGPTHACWVLPLVRSSAPAPVAARRAAAGGGAQVFRVAPEP
jgi:hypothetical protein